MRNFIRKRFGRAKPSPPRLPDGLRVYAIGDVHGRADLLDAVLSSIETDNAARGHAVTHIVFLGDLIDRGPSSRQVLERIVTFPPQFAAVDCLMGNHEEAFLRAWRGESEHDRSWLRYGGRETLESYGVGEVDFYRVGFSVHKELHARVPLEQAEFIAGLKDSVTWGDYLFVHAGVRPGVALDKQSAKDLRWIREGFLDDRRYHGKVIVHGHTISEEPELLPNRIGIDTGAYRTGRLTALGLERDEQWLLTAQAE